MNNHNITIRAAFLFLRINISPFQKKQLQKIPFILLYNRIPESMTIRLGVYVKVTILHS